MIFREEGHGDYLDEKEAEAYRFYNEILESIDDIFKKYPDSIDAKTLFALASLVDRLQKIKKLPSFNFLLSTREEKLIIYKILNAIGNDLHNNIYIFENKYSDITDWDDMYKKITIKFRNRNSHTPSNETLVTNEGSNGKLTEIYDISYESETDDGITIQNQHVFNVEHTATNNEKKEKEIVTALEKIPELAKAINAVLAREIGTNSKIKNVKLEITPVNPQTN